MAAWSGWAGQLLGVLGFRNTSGNLKFLDEWHSYEKTSCSNNPISASHVWLAAPLCHGGPKRNYRTRSDGLQATTAQLKEAKFAPIYDALKSGKPYHVADNQAVVNALTEWGSLGFADKYATQGAPAPPKTTGLAPHAQQGWHDFIKAVVNLQGEVLQARGNISYALAMLGHGRKGR